MYCKKCGNQMDSVSGFCSNCAEKQVGQNNELNVGKSKKKQRISIILGICAGALFVLSVVVLFLGVMLCFSDPVTGENISGLSFDVFGETAGIMIAIAVVLAIFIVILNIVKFNKNKK